MTNQLIIRNIDPNHPALKDKPELVRSAIAYNTRQTDCIRAIPKTDRAAMKQAGKLIAMDIKKAINLQGANNRPDEETMMDIARNIYDAFPQLIPNKFEISKAIGMAAKGVIQVKLETFQNTPSLVFFFTLMRAYLNYTLNEEDKHAKVLTDYTGKTEQEKAIEVRTAICVDVLIPFIGSIQPDSEIHYSTTPKILLFGWGYNVFDLAGLICATPEQKWDAVARAKKAIAVDELDMLGVVPKSQEERIKSRAKDILFIDWLNANKHDMRKANVAVQAYEKLIPLL